MTCRGVSRGLCGVAFTVEYCSGSGKEHRIPRIFFLLLALDTVQIILNIPFGHAFDVEATDVQGKIYYRLLPHFGQTIHRVMGYSIFAAVILIFIVVIRKMPRIYRERYTVILLSMIVVVLWQAFYIFSRTPVDRSMIGFGCFGLLAFYFAICYRPLRLLDRMLSNIAAGLGEALFAFDPNRKCIWANEPAEKLLDIKNDELDSVPEKLRSKFGVLDFSKTRQSYNVTLGSGDDASYFYLEKRPVYDNSGKDSGSFLVVRNNTEEQRRMKRELYNSTHDSLTGLYTKQHLYECIRQKLDTSGDTPYLAVFVDVKNFKIVNDIFSSEFGDLALQQIADRIRPEMTERCVYGRLAGDTFGVFVPADEFDSEQIERELTGFTVTDGTVEHHILIHLGVYEVTDKDTDVSVMFDRAHLALSSINDDYNKHIAYYDNKLRDKVLWDQKISASLHDAIAQGQVRPYLQPITGAEGKVAGAEALARWIHPEHGFMSPAAFIPVFEKNGMIVELDRHMWRCACEILSRWSGSHGELFISVNISPKDFYFTDVVAEIKALVSEYGIEPARLRIEITETVMMNDAQEKMKILEELRCEGFIVEMDDFGSGYSSLNLLKDMPVDVLKLDMKFLSSSDDDVRSQTIIKNIIKLTDDLGIASLTEGVETQQQFISLAKMGCQLFQGYYFAKPMPVDEFEKFAFK